MGKDTQIFPNAPEEYLEKYSLLMWEGFRFLNGTVKAKMQISQLSHDTAAGFVIRNMEGRSAIIGVIQKSPSSSGTIGLWQKRGEHVEKIYSCPLPSIVKNNEWYDFSVDVHSDQITIHADSNSFKVTVQGDPRAGHLGLIKFSDSLVRFKYLCLEVSESD